MLLCFRLPSTGMQYGLGVAARLGNPFKDEIEAAQEEARVEESILFEGVNVGAGSRLFRTIVDKEVTIPPGTLVGVDHEQDKQRFTVSTGGVVVIPRRMKLKP